VYPRHYPGSMDPRFQVVETPGLIPGKGVKQSIFYTSQPLISPLIISNRIFTILEGIFEA